MWPARYWNLRMWARRYWTKVGATPAPGTGAIQEFGLGQKKTFSSSAELGGGGW